MDMRSTRSFKSKRKAITAVEREEDERGKKKKSVTRQNMCISGALMMMQHTYDCCSGLGRELELP